MTPWVLFRTFGYVGAIFSSSLISLTFGTKTTDTGLNELGIVVAVIGAAPMGRRGFR